MKTAIVTGCPGQDASYLCELLLEKNYRVVGVTRRSTRVNSNMIECEHHPNFSYYTLDICDASGVRNMIEEVKPQEFYNLAAMSHVGQSFKEPQQTLMIDGLAVVHMLEAIRKIDPSIRFYQASTSEMFGNNFDTYTKPYPGDKEFPSLHRNQCEQTPLSPNSPYAAAKIYAHQMVQLYRKSYGLHASCGILFNHESPRRGLDFVTRKITDGVAKIKCGKLDKLRMGNLEAIRDWGHARDYVHAMWLMLQQDKPDDYVISTGITASVKQALEYVCDLAGLRFEDVYEQDDRFMRPSDVPYLCGDSFKAREVLGWEPTYDWMNVLTEMYEHDLNLQTNIDPVRWIFS